LIAEIYLSLSRKRIFPRKLLGCLRLVLHNFKDVGKVSFHVFFKNSVQNFTCEGKKEWLSTIPSLHPAKHKILNPEEPIN
jgi:hypothetical protein